jgi:hypothetical protein
MGMTWKLKVIRVVFVVAIVAALAMALAANFADVSSDSLLGI